MYSTALVEVATVLRVLTKRRCGPEDLRDAEDLLRQRAPGSQLQLLRESFSDPVAGSAFPASFPAPIPPLSDEMSFPLEFDSLPFGGC